MRGDDLLGKAVVLAVVVLGSLGVVVWAGAWLAAFVVGGTFHAGVAEAVGAAFELPGHLLDPAEAWPDGTADALPGPVVYWAATLLVLALSGALVAGVLWVWGRVQYAGTPHRDRLGVPARAWMAKTRDLAPLLVAGPQRGRFILGRFRGQFVATECRATTPAAPRRSARERQGDTGAVALVGPSRSGKTVAAVAGILEWEGPAILSSVKSDLLASTVGWRAQIGDVKVYDPLGLTGAGGSGWSPLATARTPGGAQRSARNLLEAIGEDGTENLGMWKNLAEFLLAGLLWTAANSARDMSAVVEWVLTQDRPRPDAPSELDGILRELLESPDPAVAGAAPKVVDWLVSTWQQDERQRSSVYITAQSALNAFSDPLVAAAARTTEIDIDWLLSGDNTLYICAPLKDRDRLAPAFGGLVNDLMTQIYEHANRKPSGRLEDQLLAVLDEAGNQRLDQLPEYASTVAGLGVQLVTIWQSVAQIERAYGRASGTLLTNHLSKLFYAGLSDKDSLEYVSRVLGEEEVESRDLSGHWSGLIRDNVMDRTARVALAQPHCLRQMRPGDALLIHGTLPPAHLRARKWFEEPQLKERGGLPIPNSMEPDADQQAYPALPPLAVKQSAPSADALAALRGDWG